MKVYIKRNPSTPTGYEIVDIDDFGNTHVMPIVDKVPDKATNGEFDWYLLPPNCSNRKMINSKKIKDGLELMYKEPRTLAGIIASMPRKKWEDYLTDEEKAQIEALRNKAKERREADKKKPMSEKEKLELRIAKLTEQLKAMGDE
jgi:hypothetical protein